jgi:integrase
MKFCKLNTIDELLKIDMQKAIIDYVVSLKESKLSHSTIHVLLSAIYHFCEMSDIVVNKKRIRKYKGERKRVVKDRAYTHNEISILLNLAEIRIKAIVLLMSSSGIRVGSIPFLQIRHLKKMTDGIYKITIYENSSEEYFTFCTPECGKAIDTYLEYRKRNGENLYSESYLIRKQFDIRDLRPVIDSNEPICLPTLRGLIDTTAIRAGLRHVKHGKPKRERKQLALTHAFRKFFTNQLVNSKVNPEIREMLLGHKIGLASCYYRPTEEEMLNEYMKAVDMLTINEENRLRIKVAKLEVEKTDYDALAAEIASIKKKMKLG